MREGKEKRDEMRREVGGQGAVYHTQVTILRVNHCMSGWFVNIGGIIISCNSGDVKHKRIK